MRMPRKPRPTSDHYTKADKARLAPSRIALAHLMIDGGWWDPYELAKRLGQRNIGTITSRLRDLKASGIYDYRRQRFGALHKYQLFVRQPEQLPLLEIAAQ